LAAQLVDDGDKSDQAITSGIRASRSNAPAMQGVENAMANWVPGNGARRHYGIPGSVTQRLSQTDHRERKRIPRVVKGRSTRRTDGAHIISISRGTGSPFGPQVDPLLTGAAGLTGAAACGIRRRCESKTALSSKCPGAAPPALEATVSLFALGPRQYNPELAAATAPSPPVRRKPALNVLGLRISGHIIRAGVAELS
jgi:hypothetical protein